MNRSTHHGARAMAALLVLLMLPASASTWAASDEPAGPSGETAVARLSEAPPSPAGEEQAGGSGGNTGTGSYRGTITDRKSGKPVEGATVVFLNEQTNETFEAKTDDKGLYEVRLPSGEYVVDIKVGRKTYRSTGTFKEEAAGRRWTMDFTVGTKLTEKDLKIATTPRDIRVMPAEPRPPLEASKKWMEFFIFIGGLAVVGALAN